MTTAILCCGKLKDYYYEAAAEYQKRLSRYMRLEVLEVPDEPEGKDQARILAIEGQRMLMRLRPDDTLIALCIEGNQVSSEAFAQQLQVYKAQGKGRIVYVIGGSLGLSEDVLKRAQSRLSLSKMTLPHQLTRVILLEQLYRACMIEAGQRYHK